MERAPGKRTAHQAPHASIEGRCAQWGRLQGKRKRAAVSPGDSPPPPPNLLCLIVKRMRPPASSTLAGAHVVRESDGRAGTLRLEISLAPVPRSSGRRSQTAPATQGHCPGPTTCSLEDSHWRTLAA